MRRTWYGLSQPGSRTIFLRCHFQKTYSPGSKLWKVQLSVGGKVLESFLYLMEINLDIVHSLIKLHNIESEFMSVGKICGGIIKGVGLPVTIL